MEINEIETITPRRNSKSTRSHLRSDPWSHPHSNPLMHRSKDSTQSEPGLTQSAASQSTKISQNTTLVDEGASDERASSKSRSQSSYRKRSASHKKDMLIWRASVATALFDPYIDDYSINYCLSSMSCRSVVTRDDEPTFLLIWYNIIINNAYVTARI